MLNMKNIQNPLIYLIVIFFLSYNSVYSQTEEDYLNDQGSFLSLSGGINSTQYNSSDRLFNDSKAGIGYNFALSHYLIPDFAFDTFFFRTKLSFSSESSKSQETTLYQNTPVFTVADDKFLGLHLFAAYRFDPQAKLDAYIGGGIFGQTRVNDPDEALIFVTEDGEQFPVFSNDPSAPRSFQSKAPSTVLGVDLETGAFFTLANNIASVELGLRYGFFVSSNSESLSLDKTSLFLNLGYQLF
jgi:hypothetical protein